MLSRKDAAELGPTLAASQAQGFPVGGESLAVDLADTLVTVTDPATDLLKDQGASDAFWVLHAALLPPGWTSPSLAKTRLVRDAVRTLLDAAQRGTLDRAVDLRELNAILGSVSTSFEIGVHDGNVELLERWHAADLSDLAPAAAARSAVETVASPERRAALRRCASPACSMLYVRGDSRRRWCTPNICSNRDRAARHYRRHRAGG
jgi:predicted RNA-binding Zn ribbon-like protein